MSSQIRFFDKSKCDLTQPNCVATASEGQAFVDLARNRSNDTWWTTQDSLDSNNTTYEMNLVDMFGIDSILLIGHNFKSYTLKYWDGFAYQNFSTTVAPTTNTKTTTFHQFTEVNTTKILLTILGTFVADEDKKLAQFIITKQVRKLNAWPAVKNPSHDQNIKKTKMLSGKNNVTKNLIGFSVELDVVTLSDSTDLDAFDSLFFSGNSFLVWLCGGDEDQFIKAARGFRLQDIYLMQPVSIWTPEPYQGFYGIGYKTAVQLTEVIA